MGTHTSTITRTGATASDTSTAVAFSWRIEAGTGTNPVNAADFPGGAFPSGSGTIAAGAASAVVTFTSNPDTTVEQDETGVLIVSTTQNGVTITGSPQPFTITNDDSAAPAPGYGPTTTQDTGVQDTGSTSHIASFDFVGGKLVARWLLGLDSTGQNAAIGIEQISDGIYRSGSYVGGVFTVDGGSGKGVFPAENAPLKARLNPDRSTDLLSGDNVIASWLADNAKGPTGGTRARVVSLTSGQTLTNARVYAA